MFGKWFGNRRSEKSPAPAFAIELSKIGGAPELDFLFIEPSVEDVVRALDGWLWVGLDGLTAIAITAWGDTFFRASDGSIVFLDTIEGGLKRVADNLAHLTAQLQETSVRDELLLAGFVIGARERGLILEPTECYDFVLAPIVGGEMSVEKMQKLFYVVKVDLAGQLHEQVKDLPPGTKISGSKISD